MKVVLDTNIVVSGLLNSKGFPAQILNLCLSGAIQVYYDERILAEYREVLARPRFKFDPIRVGEVLAKLQVDGASTDCSGHSGFGLPDPDDEPFLEVALAAEASFLITGNLVHFPAAQRRGCSVVSPAEFITHWRKLQGGETG